MWCCRAYGLAFLLAVFLTSAPVFSAGDLTRQEPIEVKVELGTADGAYTFAPNDLSFETGKLYKLVLSNPSKTKHYFTSAGLAARVYTRKVQIVDGKGTLAEIKGLIREIEVYPGGTAEWWFVPVATGKLDDLRCNIKDRGGQTHAEKGMIGTITIN